MIMDSGLSKKIILVLNKIGRLTWILGDYCIST
jgi:hypothetical protein